MKKKTLNGCPDNSKGKCEIETGRQYLLSEGQKAKIIGIAYEDLEGAMTCNHCGLVYKKAGRETLRLGRFDNITLNGAFKPSNAFP